MSRDYLLFDFDGVIVDTVDISYESRVAIDPNPPTKEEYRRLFEGNIYETNPNAAESVREDNTVDENHPFFQHYNPRLLAQPPIEGIRGVLADLARHHTLVIVSSTIKSPLQTYLDRYNLAEFFDTILGADIHTSKIKKIRMVFEMYSTTPMQCLFITDTLGDMREAMKTGVQSVGVTWGFHDAKTLERGNPIGIATTPHELHQLIDSLKYGHDTKV